MLNLPIPGFQEEEEEKFFLPEPGGLQTRGEITQAKMTLPEPGTVLKTELGEKVTGDMQGIVMPGVTAPVEDPYPNLVKNITARVYSPLERSLVNIGNFFRSMTGQEPYFHAPVTEKVQQKYAYGKEQALSKGFLQEVLAEIVPAAEQFFGVMFQIRGLHAVLAGTAGVVMASKQQNITTPFLKTAAMKFLISEGTPAERLHQAAFTMAASITPLIINTTGATGFGAVACDSLLNMILSNKTYTDALAQAENPQDFIKTIIPQLVVDIGLAWNTRGGTEIQIKAAYDKYEKQAGKTLTLKLREFTDLVKASKEFEAKEKSIERTLVPKFSEKQWKVTDTKSLAKLGNALAKKVGLGDWDIVWDMSDKPKKMYTGFALITHKQHKEAVIHIYNPTLKGKGEYDAESTGTFLKGFHSKTHKNLCMTLLHELAHLGEPTTDRVHYYDFSDMKSYVRASKKTEHDKTFHKWVDEHKKALYEEEITVKQAVQKRIAEVEAGEKGQPLLTDKIDREFVKDYTTIQRMVAGVKSVFGVQDALKDAGAPETGFHLKNFPGMVAMGHDKGIVTISSITKMAKKIGVAKDDYATFAEMTYMIESRKYKSSMPKELVEKYKDINDTVNKFYKEYEDKFKEIGWLEVPFPQSLINRNEANIKTLQAKLKDAKGIQIKSIQTEIKELQDVNARIGEENLSFVSVPIRMILRDNDAAITKHFMSLLPKWGRKTITIKDLVEEGVLTEKEADIRSIIGEYTNRMSKKYALGLVFKAAEDDGLITPAWKQPNWDTFDEKISPQLKGKKVNPILNNLLIAYISAANSKTSNYQQMIGLTKMMQFYNPLFLPMYDVVQAAAAGTFTSLKTPISFVKGIHDVLTKTKTFWAAQEDGIFSKPFYLKEDAYTARLNKHLEKNTLLKVGKKIIPSIYTLSWNTAWTLDAMVRMMTYRHFVDKGMSSRESAQTAAMFHGDYASLPPNTRKFMNQFLFTPTFKISMGKLGANMVKGAIKTAFDYKGATKTDKAYAAGLVRAYGIMAGLEAIMHHWGYETEEKFRKYSREVETEDGVKESVITFAHPLNLLWRYAYRGAKAYEPDVQNKLDKLCEQAEYELTPLYNIALKVRRNKYNKIYNPNDEPDKQIADAVKYSMREIVAISKMVFASEEEQQTKKETYKVLKDQLGNLTAVFLTPFVFHYLRDIKDVRLKNRIIAFKKANAGILDQDEFETDEEYFKRYDNYLRKLDALYEQY